MRVVLQEGVEVDLTAKQILHMKMLETVRDEEEMETEKIELKEISSNVFEPILEFINHYNSHPYIEVQTPLESDKLSEITSAWNVTFLNKHEKIIEELFIATVYLQIQTLTNLLAAYFLWHIRSCATVEDMRTKFNIRNDYTSDELTQINKDWDDLV